MCEFKFIPGGRILANVGVKGRPKATAYNCYVYNPHDFGVKDIDSIEGIFKTLAKSAKILASEGGIGINFTFIRPNGEIISGTGVRTPGVVKFMQLWDKSSDIITRGSTKPLRKDVKDKLKKKTRKGAMMGVMSISHPEIRDFITVKQQANTLTKFNLSVLVPDRFMQAVENDEMWQLVFPDTSYASYEKDWDGDLEKWIKEGKPVIVHQELKARELWDLITLSTYNRNEPGVLFYDTFNNYNPLSYCQTIITTNPCLTGDTLIAVADGRNAVTIKQLTQQGKEFPVYSMGQKVQIVKGKAFKTKQNATVVKVVLDDNTMFTCTPDHKIMLRNGKYREAKDLKENDSLMPFNSYISNKQYRQISSNVSKDRRQLGGGLVDHMFTRTQELEERYNHKVKFVQFLQQKYDVYDITVNSDNHNFGIITSFKDQKFIESSGVFVHNCAQIGMSSGVCNLGSLNLPRFYKDGQFDWDQFELAIRMGVCFLDNVHEVSYLPLQEYKTIINKKRRIGLGVTGLGSLLYMMGLKFGSYKAVKFTEQLFKFKAETEMLTSAIIGKQKGSFEDFDKEKYFETIWWQELDIPYKTKRFIENIGAMRNGVTSTVPPCGNSSIFLDNVSNGIEPVFMKEYARWMTLGDQDLLELQEVHNTLCNSDQGIPDLRNGQFRQTPIFKFAQRGDQQILRGNIDGVNYEIDKNRGVTKEVIVRDYGYKQIIQKDLPTSGIVETTELSIDDHLTMLATSAKYINQNQSKTINIPQEYPFEEFKDVYFKIWKNKIKGATTYRAGTMSAVLEQKKTNQEYLSELQKMFKESNGNVIFDQVKIPEKSFAMHYKIKDKNTKKWYITIVFADQKLTRPFAMFIRTNNRESNQVADIVIQSMEQLLLFVGISEQLVINQRQKYQGQSNVDKIGRAIGMALRHNVPITQIVQTLERHSDGLSTLLFHVKKLLSSFIKDGTKIEGKTCENCGSESLIYQAGCSTCSNCGHSKCS